MLTFPYPSYNELAELKTVDIQEGWELKLINGRFRYWIEPATLKVAVDRWTDGNYLRISTYRL